MLPRMPKAVVFDMDGLILDSEALYRASMISAAHQGGYPIGPSIYEAMLGRPWSGIAALLTEHYGADFSVEDFRGVWTDHFKRLAATELRLKQGVEALLDTLDTLSIPRAIATSSSHRQVEHHLSGFDIIRRFDHVVASGDYARGKPFPDPYLVAAERLGVSPGDCLALEDSHNGIRSAAAAGMMAVMVPDLLPPTTEIEALCTRVMVDLFECRAALYATLGGPMPMLAHPA